VIRAEEKHSYDTADRLTDPGTSYNTFGDITALPAADAGGSELTSAFYTDNQLASQTQNGQTIGYNLDPAGRTLETVATGKRAETTTNHYAGPGSSPAWTSNSSGETTRDIAGISGFAAVQSNSEAPVLQITNLHGDIVGTAYLSETATALASSADTSEFGVPTTSLPPKYSWLGADEIPTELPSGVLNMGARSYVPQLGRFLQPDPIPGGSANAYSYTFGNPVNESDPSGSWTFGLPAWLRAADAGWSARSGQRSRTQGRRRSRRQSLRRKNTSHLRRSRSIRGSQPRRRRRMGRRRILGRRRRGRIRLIPPKRRKRQPGSTCRIGGAVSADR
jgi:RHS repeat-associated protein